MKRRMTDIGVDRFGRLASPMSKAEAEAADAGLAEHEASLKVQMQTEARDRLEAYKQARKGGRPSDTNASDDDD